MTGISEVWPAGVQQKAVLHWMRFTRFVVLGTDAAREGRRARSTFASRCVCFTLIPPYCTRAKCARIYLAIDSRKAS